MNDDIKFMKIALEEAQKAFKKGEIPVGAVIVKDGIIVSKAHNLKETKNNAIKHAEITAIEKACAKLHNWRLIDCDMYVTLLPCPMCASAISQSRIRKVVYGANNDNVDKELICAIFNAKNSNIVEISGGILENTCGKLLKDFFSEKR
mgnify:CR=1 FL=1